MLSTVKNGFQKYMLTNEVANMFLFHINESTFYVSLGRISHEKNAPFCSSPFFITKIVTQPTVSRLPLGIKAHKLRVNVWVGAYYIVQLCL